MGLKGKDSFGQEKESPSWSWALFEWFMVVNADEVVIPLRRDVLA